MVIHATALHRAFSSLSYHCCCLVCGQCAVGETSLANMLLLMVEWMNSLLTEAEDRVIVVFFFWGGGGGIEIRDQGAMGLKISERRKQGDHKSGIRELETSGKKGIFRVLSFIK